MSQAQVSSVQGGAIIVETQLSQVGLVPFNGFRDNLLPFRHSMTSVTGHTCNFSMSDDFIEIVDNGAESPNCADLRSDIFPML